MPKVGVKDFSSNSPIILSDEVGRRKNNYS